jgi:branched-chain amino acid aminotransferase
MAGQSIAYFEGEYMPLTEAKISIVDPVVSKSDIVFDVVSMTERSFFRFDDHLDRFEASCRGVRIKPPVSRDEIKRISAECVDRSGFDEACVYFCGTRGLYAGGVALGDPRTCENGFYAYAVPYYWVVPRERIETGAHLKIVQTRRAPSEAIDQRVKNFNRMDLTKGTFEALDAGADAPLLLSMNGHLTEGPGFNVWIVRDKTLLTPGDDLLEGITRRTVFDLAKELGLKAEAADLGPDELRNAPEAFMSSTAGGIFPVTRVDDKPLGNGAPGITTGQIRSRYWEKRRAGWHGTKVDDLLTH